MVFAGGWAARLAYRIGLQGSVVATTHEVRITQGSLPRALRIAFASDFHAGPLTDARVLREAFSRIRAFEPDLILLGGDFVGLHSRHIGEFCDVVEGLRAPQGVFAVLGNHDLWKGAAVIGRALEAAGVTVLRNDSVRLRSPFESVVLGGLDDPVVGSPDAVATFRGQQGLRIALMHSPEGAALLQGHSVAVAFAGHTHGGQVCLPGGRALIVPSNCWRWKQGWFAVDGVPGGMIVSRGVGVSTLPVRTACSSEVVLCELHGG